jgi:hypothetical protein
MENGPLYKQLFDVREFLCVGVFVPRVLSGEDRGYGLSSWR